MNLWPSILELRGHALSSINHLFSKGYIMRSLLMMRTLLHRPVRPCFGFTRPDIQYIVNDKWRTTGLVMVSCRKSDKAGLRLIFWFEFWFEFSVFITSSGRQVYGSIFSFWITAFLISHCLHLEHSVGRDVRIILAIYTL